MSALVFYIGESALLLVILFLVYKFLLSNETYFQLNRFVLLATPVVALSVPLMKFDLGQFVSSGVRQPLHHVTDLSREYYDIMVAWEFGQQQAAPHENAVEGFGWIEGIFLFVLVVYIVGFVFCALRTARSLRWIFRTIAKNSIVIKDGVKIVPLNYPTAPFSFLNYVFVSAETMESEDFPQIFRHERTHIEEKHTFDLLYMQIAVAFLWFNPAIWQLQKSLKTTHEYIADKKIIESGYSVVEYQILLLRQLISNNSPGLVHNFNLSFMKKRIIMMTTKPTGWTGGAKVCAGIVTMLCLTLCLVQCNSRLEDDTLTSPLKSERSPDVRVPTLPSSGFRFGGDLTNTLTFTIAGNTLYIGEEIAQLDDIANIQDDRVGRKLPIIMKVHEDQEMGFVRNVHDALRKADRRHLLYLGQTTSGERVEVSLVLPPTRETVTDLSTDIPEERLLKIFSGAGKSIENQRRVYDFVVPFVDRGLGELPVVSIKFKNSDRFESYLQDFFFSKEGYIQIYQQRARSMFGKDFYATTREEYEAVREKIPMNISIAEN